MSQFRPKCLIVDDDSIVSDFFNFILGDKAEYITLNSVENFSSTIRNHIFDIAFIDLHIKDHSGLNLIQELKEYAPNTPIIAISSTQEVEKVIRAFRLGAVDFLTKPINEDLVKQQFRKALHLKKVADSYEILSDKTREISNSIIIGDHFKTRQLKEEIAQLKNFELDTLITGESGCGKELVARELHFQNSSNNNNNKDRPYITLNCSAIPSNLMESILFGHEKGSFTGAVQKQIGKFELAHGGDIFLDEIGTLPLELQAKLLRTLQEREIEPIGLGTTKKLNFRVIAATNENLIEMVKGNQFRKDLYFRLNKVILHIPPLRERIEDIPMLIEHFIKKKSKTKKIVSNEAMTLLMEHSWPGNIRELENIIDNLIITTRGEMIEKSHIQKFNLGFNPFDDLVTPNEVQSSPKDVFLFDTGKTLEENLLNCEKCIIEKSLSVFKKKQEAADHLGIDRRTLSRKINFFGLK
jgi:DNA-binding NtrC family response regulator